MCMCISGFCAWHFQGHERFWCPMYAISTAQCMAHWSLNLQLIAPRSCLQSEDWVNACTGKSHFKSAVLLR